MGRGIYIPLFTLSSHSKGFPVTSLRFTELHYYHALPAHTSRLLLHVIESRGLNHFIYFFVQLPNLKYRKHFACEHLHVAAAARTLKEICSHPNDISAVIHSDQQQIKYEYDLSHLELSTIEYLLHIYISPCYIWIGKTSLESTINDCCS